MEKESLKKIALIVFACIGVLAIYFSFNYLIQLQKTDKEKVSSAFKFLSENMHTGLVNSPATQLAFNNNTDKNADQYAANVPAEKFPGQKPSPSAGISPNQLFDITLEIDKTSISSSKELFARVTFTSFGSVPTPCQMTFDVMDSSGNVIYTEQAKTVVETEAVYNQRFGNFPLPVGQYILRLRTLYNTSVSDEFRQPFKVVVSVPPISWTYPTIVASMALLIIIISLVVIIKRTK